MRGKIFMIFGILTLIYLGISPSFAWWNDSWAYRKQINITERSGNDLTDYQVAINLTYDSNMQPDFSDIRFTWYNESSGEEVKIPYWIEQKVDESWAYVWVKVPEIPANDDAVVYVYYKNTTLVTSESNGTAVFEFFDDFEGTSLDTSKWDTTGGSITVSNSEACFGPHDYALHSMSLLNSKIIYWVDWGSSNKKINLGWIVKSNPDPTYGVFASCSSDDFGDCITREYDGTNDVRSSAITVSNGKLIFYFLNDVAKTCQNETCTDTITRQYTTPDSIGIAGWGSLNADICFDKVLVKKYTDPEPTYSIGAEEVSIDYSNINVTPESPQTYPVANITFNITWSSPAGISSAWIRHNFTGEFQNYTMTNTTPLGTEVNFTYTFENPPAGYFVYQFFANDTNGNIGSTPKYSYTINKAPTTLNLTITGTAGNVTYTYPVVTNTTGWANVTGGTLYLYRNGSLVNSSQDVVSEIVQLPAGYYEYTLAFEHQNYTADNLTYYLTIQKRDAEISLTSSNGWNIYEGSSTTILCSASSYAPDPILKIDNVIVSNPYTLQVELRNYVVSCSVSDTQNFTNTEKSQILYVNPLLACTSNETFAFKYSYNSSATFNFTKLVEQGLVRKNLGDIWVENATSVSINLTDGYFLIVSGDNYTIYFGNYFVNNSYPQASRTSPTVSYTHLTLPTTERV